MTIITGGQSTIINVRPRSLLFSCLCSTFHGREMFFEIYRFLSFRKFLLQKRIHIDVKSSRKIWRSGWYKTRRFHVTTLHPNGKLKIVSCGTQISIFSCYYLFKKKQPFKSRNGSFLTGEMEQLKRLQEYFIASTSHQGIGQEEGGRTGEDEMKIEKKYQVCV